MRQGETAPQGKWTGNPQGGVKAPQAIIPPSVATRFADTANRLDVLAAGHPMADWLRFLAELTRAQHSVATKLTVSLPPRERIDQVVAARMPPFGIDGHGRQAIWRDGLSSLIGHFDDKPVPAAAKAVMTELAGRSPAAIEALADSVLHGGLTAADAGAALYVAASLQVYFTRLAANLDAGSLRLLEQRGLCPCCGSTSVAGIVTASGETPGARYLYCSLCSTAWNHVRAVCITCGDTRTLSLQGIEGDAGTIKAETCDSCHTYAKVMYAAKDMQVDPYADDLASLGLDIMVAEAGWARHAPNPLLLVS